MVIFCHTLKVPAEIHILSFRLNFTEFLTAKRSGTNLAMNHYSVLHSVKAMKMDFGLEIRNIKLSVSEFHRKCPYVSPRNEEPQIQHRRPILQHQQSTYASLTLNVPMMIKTNFTYSWTANTTSTQDMMPRSSLGITMLRSTRRRNLYGGYTYYLLPGSTRPTVHLDIIQSNRITNRPHFNRWSSFLRHYRRQNL